MSKVYSLIFFLKILVLSFISKALTSWDTLLEKMWDRDLILSFQSLLLPVFSIIFTVSVCYVLLSQFQLLTTLWINNVHRVLDSAALLSSCRPMPMASSWSQSISHLVFLFSCCLLFYPEYCFSKRTLPSHYVPELGQIEFCHFCLQQCFRVSLLYEPLVHYSGTS